MPNWCENCLEICVNDLTERQQLEKSLLVRDKNTGFLELDLNLIAPPPADCGDWYSWVLTHWGTRCVDTCTVYLFDQAIICCFDSAWKPPESWFARFCQMFPDISMSLYFYEPGDFFAGEFISDQDGGYSRIIPETEEEIRELACDVFGEVFDDEINDHD